MKEVTERFEVYCPDCGHNVILDVDGFDCEEVEQLEEDLKSAWKAHDTVLHEGSMLKHENELLKIKVETLEHEIKTYHEMLNNYIESNR